MLPVVRLVVGPWMVVVSAHALAVLLAVGAGAALAARRVRGVGPAVLVAAAVVTVAGLAGARGLFVLLHGAGGSGGLASTGGIAVGLFVLPLAARVTGLPARPLADALLPAGLLGLAIGRAGCFLAGCCIGTATVLPWGVVLPDLGPPARHPLPLYEALGCVGLLAALPRGTGPAGQAAARAALGYGCLRAGLECLRDPAATDPVAGGLTTAQAAAGVLAVGALVVLCRLRPRGPVRYASPPEELRSWPTRSR